MQYGYDQSLMIYPEAGDGADECQFSLSMISRRCRSISADLVGVWVVDLEFFLSEDCSGDPLLLSPPASTLRERPVAGCSNYAAAGITKMSYRVFSK
jgi:hypothetical protein